MSRRRLPPLALALVLLAGSGHVGTLNVLYEGMAGPYPVRVSIRPPGVVPGLAQISVRLDERDADGVRLVSVRPVRADRGLDGAPRADVATPVRGATGLYAAELWFMTRGTYSVHVRVEGEAGEGTAVVPFHSRALRTLEMDGLLRTILIALCLFLFAGALTWIAAAVRESVLPPGVVPDAKRRRRARWVSGAAAALLVLALLGGKRWWDAIDSAYRDNLYEPPRISTEVRTEPGGEIFSLSIVERAWQEGRYSPLVPDHGKLMHMFLIREEEMDVLAHLHPAPIDGSTFETPLPPLPAGRYRVFADIVHESGLAQTLVDQVEIPDLAADPPAPGLDPDDAWRVDASAIDPDSDSDPLPGGFTMRWERSGESLTTGVESDLAFRLFDAEGREAVLEPYMGMMGHAVVARDDGAVFVHLHPMGTVSMAAQERLILRQLSPPGGDDHTRHGAEAHGSAGAARDAGLVVFPFEFPEPGRYRIWVQVAHDGEIRTGAFEATVAEGRRSRQ